MDAILSAVAEPSAVIAVFDAIGRTDSLVVRKRGLSAVAEAASFIVISQERFLVDVVRIGASADFSTLDHTLTLPSKRHYQQSGS